MKRFTRRKGDYHTAHLIARQNSKGGKNYGEWVNFSDTEKESKPTKEREVRTK